MRQLAAASVVGTLLWACGSEPGPTLTLTPSGTQTISAPITITAGPPTLAPSVTWSLSGPGTLSGTSGPAVVYRPPPLSNVGISSTPTATVTATAKGQTASLTLQLATPTVPNGVIGTLKGTATVYTDAQDIPHVFCGDPLDCFAVQGYLQARDRLFQMDLFRRTARGQLAALVGPLEVSSDTQFLRLFTTRDGKKIEDQLVAALDTATKAKLDAYVSGVNAYLTYLKANPTLMPGEYAQIAAGLTPNDIPNWTPADTLAIGRLQQFGLSETIEKEVAYGLFARTFAPAIAGGVHPDAGRFAAYVRAKQPLAGYTLSPSDSGLPPPSAPPGGAGGSAIAPPDLSRWTPGLSQVHADMQGMHALFGTIKSGAGSNNWVVDGAHSASGKAMAANDPHLPLQYPPLFHLAALTSQDGTLNLAGGSFPGVPGALVGRGAHVGWGVTVVGYDVTDVYLESLTNCTVTPPDCATVHVTSPATADVPILLVQYTIKVRGAADQTVPVRVVPHHGPIINYDPVNASALSVRWTGHEVTQDLKAFLDLNVATAVGDASAAAGTAFAALKNYATGAQNFVLADDQGNIGYDPHALVPKRLWLTSPTSPPPWFPLPGTGAAEWGTGNIADHCAGTGANAPVPACWIDDSVLPQGVNPTKGYYATANSDPKGYSDTNDPVNNPVTPGTYLSFDWSDPTDVRYARIAALLKVKTSASSKMSFADMQSVQADHALLLARLFAPSFPAASTVPLAQQAAYTAALGILTQWGTDGYDCPTGLTGSDPSSAADPDQTHNRDSAGCLLFHAFLTKLLHNVFDDEAALVSATTGQSFNLDAGAEIRAMLYLLTLPTTDTVGTSFCSDIDRNDTTVATHTCFEQLVNALVSAQAALTQAFGPPANWLWGKVHTLTTSSPAAPLIAGPFGGGPFARPGGALTVDVGSPDGSQTSPLGFTYTHGSNVRFIADMSAPATATIYMQLPGPERDGPYGVFSNTPDLLGQYVKNQYFNYLIGHEVDAAVVSAEGFTAQ
jgi:penicillin amidase